ncbi:MAG: ribonucleotide-diphosphate reductase subunit beta [Chlamydiia bacterium]|nr:ribonucleotide-diphosphate reductase subunit beta [Chlamydiia bacterium]
MLKSEYENLSGDVVSVNDKRLLNAPDSDINQIVPIKYQFAIEAFACGCANNWMPNEVPMSDDISDWENLSVAERRFLLIGLGFIGTAESLIANNIVHSVYKYITNPECRQYLLRQAYEEALHTWTFLYITTSLHIDQDTVFNMHKNVEPIMIKDEFAMKITSSISGKDINTTTVEGVQELLRNLVGYYVIVEGIYFYGGFPMMLAPASQKKMQGLGKQIEFILRDESVHLGFGIDLINSIIEENPEVWTSEFKDDIIEMIKKAVALEENYINYALREPVFSIYPGDVIETVKFFANRRLEKIGLPIQYKGANNKLGYLSTLLDYSSEQNFFETTVSSYRVDQLEF